MEHVNVQLGNIAGGTANDLFDRELKAVLKNIHDVNTEAKETRKITMVFDITPNSDRDECAIMSKCFSKLAPVKTKGTTIYTGKQRGEIVAMLSTINQIDMFDNENVAELKTGSENNEN